MKAFFTEHKWLVIFVAAAIIIGVLLLTVGFWKTLLMAVLIGAAVLIGRLFDKGGSEAVTEFFSRLFGKGK